MKTISNIEPRKRVYSAWANLRVEFDASVLRQLRNDAGLTLREVSGYAGVSLATLERVERGHQCSLGVALKIAAFWEKPVESLWRVLTPSG